jgi:hypothetical protein
MIIDTDSHGRYYFIHISSSPFHTFRHLRDMALLLLLLVITMLSTVCLPYVAASH